MGRMVDKPTKQTITYYDWHEITHYIQEKYKISNDLMARFGDEILCDAEVSNGSFFWLVESESLPGWASTIMQLLDEEFFNDGTPRKVRVLW